MKTKETEMGVFVLIMGTQYIESNEYIDTVAGVFSTRERAEKMGNFLVKATEVEPFTDDKENKIIYLNYEVENFIVL